MFFLLLAIVIFALIFGFLNGANDAANEIATVTATKALSPIKALFLASSFNILGAFASTRVAETIGKGIVFPECMNLFILFAGVLGACTWSFICTKSGIPISITHALVGGVMGAGIAAGGIKIINWHILTDKIFLAIVLGPGVGFLAGALFLILVSWLLYLFFRKSSSFKSENFFRRAQIFTSSFLAFTHGMNDSQNAMGVITAALLAGGYIETFSVPIWVKLGCGAVMGLGIFLFGWRVIKTMGWKLARLEPRHGFAVQLGAGVTIGLKSLLGMPVSTTHVVGSAVMGGTVLENWRRIKPKIAQTMVISWIITIPCSALLGAALYRLVIFIV